MWWSLKSVALGLFLGCRWCLWKCWVCLMSFYFTRDCCNILDGPLKVPQLSSWVKRFGPLSSVQWQQTGGGCEFCLSSS